MPVCIFLLVTPEEKATHGPFSAGTSQVVLYRLYSKDLCQQELIGLLGKYLTLRIPSIRTLSLAYWRATGFSLVPTISSLPTMSDVRALLKAKRQEARIQNSYTPRVRPTGKRKVVGEDRLDDQEVHPTSESKKRKVTPEDPSNLPTPEYTSAFPHNFFSDPSKAPIRSVDNDSSEEDEDNPGSVPQVATDNPIDLEWQRFQQEMLTSTPASTDQRHEAFKRATVFAEPELLPENVLGLPPREPPGVDAVMTETPKNEEELRRRREEDEKELIMDRFLEEERAQEDADAKVALLKDRLDALKKRRNEVKAARAKKLQ